MTGEHILLFLDTTRKSCIYWYQIPIVSKKKSEHEKYKREEAIRKINTVIVWELKKKTTNL